MNKPSADIIVTEAERVCFAKLLGLAILGEQVAAKTYGYMAQISPEYASILKKFGTMEGTHAASFHAIAKRLEVQPDVKFAEGELGYLKDQVYEYRDAGDMPALAIVQGFIVECMALATYEPFLSIADKYEGARAAFEQAIADEHYHVGWIKRYLKLKYYDDVDGFASKVSSCNTRGIDCIGGTMMNIADYLTGIGIDGAQCTGIMIDHYTALLEEVGMEPRSATRNVMTLFTPLMQKYKSESQGKTAV